MGVCRPGLLIPPSVTFNEFAEKLADLNLCHLVRLFSQRRGLVDATKSPSRALLSRLQIAAAEEHPKGSDERLASLEFAHEIYLEGRRKRRGMDFLSRKTGETGARNLARAVVKSGEVPNVGSEKSRIERLARKYTKRRDKMEWHGPNMRLCEPDDPEFGDDI